MTTPADPRPRVKFFFSRAAELYLWVIIAIVPDLPLFIKGFLGSITSEEIYLDFYTNILTSLAILLFPHLFKLIYQAYPFEYLRMRNQSKAGKMAGDGPGTNPALASLDKMLQERITRDPGYKMQCIEESRKLSEKVYQRAGAYLLVGSVIAFSGIGIFYSPWFKTDPKVTEWTARLFDFLPRLGALFFIEFVAIFFLKQYRVMMDEFRYYEAILRERQDNMVYLDLLKEFKGDADIMAILKERNFNSSSRIKLASGETTESIELQKLMLQEKGILDRFTEDFKGMLGLKGAEQVRP